MNKLFFSVLFLTLVAPVLISSKAELSADSQTTFKFVLTHMNGRELERNAYFYCGDTNPFILDLKDGKPTFKFYISGSIGDMCGLYGKDQYDKSVSICLTKLSGDNTEVEIKYTDRTLRFIGYLQR